jgi:hypothetical protein
MGESGLKKIFPTLICCAPGGQGLIAKSHQCPALANHYGSTANRVCFTHRIHGASRVLGEWVRSSSFMARAAALLLVCRDLRVWFGTHPNEFMHCCRSEYLQRVQQINSPGRGKPHLNTAY